MPARDFGRVEEVLERVLKVKLSEYGPIPAIRDGRSDGEIDGRVRQVMTHEATEHRPFGSDGGPK
jgi:hypothetical protein